MHALAHAGGRKLDLMWMFIGDPSNSIERRGRLANGKLWHLGRRRVGQGPVLADILEQIG